MAGVQLPVRLLPLVTLKYEGYAKDIGVNTDGVVRRYSANTIEKFTEVTVSA